MQEENLRKRRAKQALKSDVASGVFKINYNLFDKNKTRAIGCIRQVLSSNSDGQDRLPLMTMSFLSPARREQLWLVWRGLKRAPLTAWFALFVVGCYLAVIIFAPMIAPYGEAQIVGDAYLPWSQLFLLGTDQIGRDMLSRLIYGGRNTVGIAVITTVISFMIGGFLGIIAASLGGWIDQVLSRVVDILMAIPQLIFAMVLLVIFGTSVLHLILIMAVLDSTRIFRVTRALTLNVVVLEFVEAARLQGETLLYVVTREILPNILPPLITELGLRFCFVFLTISALSFLGLGIQPPAADWGSMVRENATLINYGDITPLLPAAAIALLTISVNFLVDWNVRNASRLKE